MGSSAPATYTTAQIIEWIEWAMVQVASGVQKYSTSNGTFDFPAMSTLQQNHEYFSNLAADNQSNAQLPHFMFGAIGRIR